MKFSRHPLWLVGFRPFFALACLSGLSLPVLWAMIFSGHLAAPRGMPNAVQWHAHEMFFGFGWAVLGGFLLTSTKNWVGVRGYHGGALVFLAAAWCFERLGMCYAGVWPPLLFRVSNNLFLGSIVVMLMWTLIRGRREDSYRNDNLAFLVILPLFIVAKNLMLSAEHFQLGWSMALGLFRVAFLVMLERTLTQFMKSIFKVNILRNPALDAAIKLLGLALIGAGLLPPPLAAALDILLAVLLLLRFVFWRPRLALTRLDIGIMYLGYLAIAAQLLLAALESLAHPAWVGSLPPHVFSFGVMGLIIPAMLVRIAKGHTGRPVVFDRIDKAVLWLMVLGFVLRVVAPQLDPSAYVTWIYLAAACWLGCFATLGWRLIPFLLRPRVDGKAH